MLTDQLNLPKALFITKLRHEYAASPETYSKGLTSGLFNSANFVSTMLNASGIESAVVSVIDNNSIEREVVKANPSHVFIEALWVVPDKIELLAKRYPSIKWVIRLHSNTPFLANEGVAIEWIRAYANIPVTNVFISPNSTLLLQDLRALPETTSKMVYLPNYYSFTSKHVPVTPHEGIIRVGCFGAVRPLKNQLIQAMAAIQFANITGLTLEFHINTGRIEQRGNNALKNIRALFANSEHLLVEHGWLDRQDFLNLIRQMDINLQVSLSETFNITAADSVNELVPVIVSKDISWVNANRYADTSSSDSILRKMLDISEGDTKAIARRNWLDLHRNNARAQGHWLNFMLRG